MKTRLYITVIFAVLSCCAMQAQDGESLRDRIAKRQAQESSSAPQITLRMEMKNQEKKQNIDNASWTREIYRFLDLKKGINGALYNPAKPTGDKVNLFTTVFNLLANGTITAYRYDIAENGVFEQGVAIEFEEVLENLKAYFGSSSDFSYVKEGNRYIVDPYYIPSADAQGYYIKEIHYFDQTNSLLDTKVVAICPVLAASDSNDIGVSGYPQFWVLYEDIRPYISNTPVMTSDKNNVKNRTIDDFFRLNLYEGDIYRTTNMENKMLSNIHKTPAELKTAQENIENEIKQFEENLWIVNDSVYVKSEAEKAGKRDNPKVKKSKSSAQSATYSARDRR